ncbi:DUF3164 family protein [Mucilaginibacter sp. 5C4]|uniref:DUF3164 family protein n=1 Tax=Mucilaginibacter sp. 5C4 TaxID=3048589 RepID=UPI002AC9C0DF|nr:DUF3164 family protein [Mucilaginibacter sp. 5C4]MEB0299581.1 DUF3164 family protein [Mucilaginibacter sp. 5C4]WPX22954.1 DUF3164 family protein [Mucilaginibacter sp. 5C4]
MTIETAETLTTEQLQDLLNQRLAEQKEQEQAERNSYESLKDATVTKLATSALALNEAMRNFKDLAFGEAETLYELLQKYSKRHADGKGTFKVRNADGSMEMNLKRHQLGTFDERSVQAEKHIRDFINNRFAGDQDVLDIIMGAMERTKGFLDVKQIQRLYAMEDRFDDHNWKEGIKLLKESWIPTTTKDYLSFTIWIYQFN